MLHVEYDVFGFPGHSDQDMLTMFQAVRAIASSAELTGSGLHFTLYIHSPLPKSGYESLGFTISLDENKKFRKSISLQALSNQFATPEARQEWLLSLLTIVVADEIVYMSRRYHNRNRWQRRQDRRKLARIEAAKSVSLREAALLSTNAAYPA